MAKKPSSWGQDLGRIGLIWGLAMGVAILWVLLDRRAPAWDQSEHLSQAMNYWWTLTHSNWLSADGWRHLWMLSPKYPPVFYLVTACVHILLGPGADQALFANGLFALVLLIATYGLGRHLFSPQIGLLAAGICLLMPRLIHLGLDYQLDYAVTALIVVSFWCLTVWQDAPSRWRQWAWILGFGISLGLALMTKQAAVLFLAVPLAWATLTTLLGLQWVRMGQLLLGAIATVAVMLPWLSVNWVFQFSILENTNVRSAQVEGDPLLNTFAAWIYYWQDLPAAVSWVLLLVPLVGLVLWFVGLLPGRKSALNRDGTVAKRSWLLAYIVGSYLLWSAVVNKDPRYIAPYLPMLAIFLAWGLACWWRRWPWVTIATLALSVLVVELNLFPLSLPPAKWVATTLSPQGRLYPYQGQPLPQPELVDQVSQARPYQISTIGGLHSTAAINQHTISYYGKLKDYRVYGRQVGDRESLLEKDLRSLSWFYAQSKLDEPWPPTKKGLQAEMVRQLEQRPEFAKAQTWQLPGKRQLHLYQRRRFPVTVKALPDRACEADTLPRLRRVVIPPQVPPGQAVPVTYKWIGTWETLQTGLVLLTWEPIAIADAPVNSSQRAWIHDHGIGLGTLRPNPIQPNQTTFSAAKDINPNGCFQVTEHTATLPPQESLPGSYRLVGSYLSATDTTPQPLAITDVTVTLAANAQPVSAPELDWVTQLREVSQFLPQGPDFLDKVFEPIGRLNVYDPIQNYTVQAEKTLTQRWQANPQAVVAYGYGLVLAQVLQLKVPEAIASLEQLVQQDAENPYAHAYLGFVNLYAFHPKAAQTALIPALELAPDSPEINGLSAIAALLQGHLREAWQKGNTAIDLAVAGE